VVFLFLSLFSAAKKSPPGNRSEGPLALGLSKEVIPPGPRLSPEPACCRGRLVPLSLSSLGLPGNGSGASILSECSRLPVDTIPSLIANPNRFRVLPVAETSPLYQRAESGPLAVSSGRPQQCRNLTSAPPPEEFSRFPSLLHPSKSLNENCTDS